MTSTNDTPEPNDLYRADQRIDLLSVDDGVVVYDVENPSAWIKSDAPVPLAERR
jgi:hypothetical protein